MFRKQSVSRTTYRCVLG